MNSVFQKVNQCDASRSCVYLCHCTCAGLFVGRAAGQTDIVQLLLIIQDQLDSLHIVDAATALRHELNLNTQRNPHKRGYI